MKLKMVTGQGATPNSQSSQNILNTIQTANVQLPPGNEPAAKRPSDNRRSNKPIMEKRRRARINNCLNQLKTLILDAMKKDPARHSKLEKADILEMTVKYLENLQRQQAAMSQAADPSIVNKFKAGFTECANEVGRFPGMDQVLKQRLLQHLRNCINGVKSEIHQQMQPIQTQQQIQQTTLPNILPSPPSSPEQDHQQQSQQPIQPPAHYMAPLSSGYFITNSSGSSVQLIPAKLSNGSFAFVLPQNIQQLQPTAQTALPGLIPIPSRTSSTASAASSTSSLNYERIPRENMNSPNCYNAPLSPSSSQSYDAMECQIPQQQQHHNMPSHHHQQQHHHLLPTGIKRSHSDNSDHPISLVMKKSYQPILSESEERPWRPW